MDNLIKLFRDAQWEPRGSGSVVAEEKFKWTDELVKDFVIWHSGIYANPNPTDSCLDEFKKSKQQKQKDWEIVAYRWPEYGIDYNKQPEIIETVRRLIDNEVFSVGDKVDYCWYNDFDEFKSGVIEKIGVSQVNHKHEALFSINDGSEFGAEKYISNIRHAKKQPLFKTEDGKDVYEGDTVVLLSINTWQIASDVKAPQYPFYGEEMQFKYFSTEEAAKEYVVMNKPCLSVVDAVVEFCKWYKESEVVSGISFENSLKQFVEQKLKQ